MNKKKKLIKKGLENVVGGISEEETICLFDLAKKSKEAIVEIGSWKGKSTICLALGSSQGNRVRVWAIDPHTGSPDHKIGGQSVWTFDEFRKNISNAGVEDLVEPILKTGEETGKTWDSPVDLVFVDAQYHDYELTKKLCLLWLQKMSPGGILLLHNTVPSIKGILEHHPLHGCRPVTKFMRKDIYPSKKYKVAGVSGTISLIKKEESFSNFLWLVDSYFRYFIFSIYRLFTKLPQPVKKTLKNILGN